MQINIYIILLRFNRSTFNILKTKKGIILHIKLPLHQKN